jgi:TonB family protein
MFRIPRLIKTVVFAVVAFFLTLSAVNLPAQEGRKLISHPAPFYPETAKKMAIVGAVKVQVLIAPDGHIKETKVIGGHPMLVAAVEETLKSWKYAPASSETTATLEFNFHP